MLIRRAYSTRICVDDYKYLAILREDNVSETYP